MPRTPPPPTSPPWEASYTCDWGDCSYPTMAWRYSGQRLAESPLGWLPVCIKHAQTADAKIAHRDGSPAPSRVASHASGTPESGLRREATAADGAARPGSNGTAEPERQERAGTSPATQLNDGSPQEGS